MLVATIEIWPHGVKSARKNIAQVFVANLRTDSNNVADYGVVIKHDNGFIECKSIEGWQRGTPVKDGGGAVNLIKTALNAPVRPFNSSLIHAVNRCNEPRKFRTEYEDTDWNEEFEL
jgi:hypothetical protein